MAGAEPFSAPGGPHGVLMVHGFTGSPASMRPLGAAFAAAGFAVEAPLLPGHGTALEDLIATTWADWSAAVDAAYEELTGRCERVVVAGLSMGGTLACRLAARHPEVAGLVCVNPMVEPAAESFLDTLRVMLDQGVTVLPGMGEDVARPGVEQPSYGGMPVAPLLSLFTAVADLAPRLRDVRCPLLLLTSSEDHVVPPSSSDFLAARVSGPVERVMLYRSYHVATLDWDAEEVRDRAVAFARAVTSS